MVKTQDIREWSNEFRLIQPEAVRSMELSMRSTGQLQPLILLKNDDGYHIIDGIKRYRSALEIGLKELQSLVFEVDMAMAKAMIFHYNRHNSSLSMYEQGLIVRSLIHDHAMSQKEVARVLRQSHSWVCRRLSLIEKLLPGVQDALRMGGITVSHGRELVKLPRGNQGQALAVVIREGLTSRECAIVVEKLLKASGSEDAGYIYNHSREVIQQATRGDKLHDGRLSDHGNRLLKARELLRLQVNILGGVLQSEHTAQLPPEQKAMVLPPMDELVAPRVYSSKLDPYKEYIQDTLQQFGDITVQRIYEKILEKGYTGKISIPEVCVAGIRTSKTKEVIRCVETAPGQRAAHDWSEYMIGFTSSHGREHKVIFFGYIPGYSRRQYIEVVEDKTQRTLFECLVHAFMYFDGVAREIKSDNQKVCVERWECGQPIFNRHYLGFASHYGFRPLAIHPRRPVENLKVERPFYYLETNFLNGRRFRDKNDLKEQLRSWLTQVNDVRLHRTTRRRPIEMFAGELPCLLPLPTAHYDTSLIVCRVVNQESCVHYQGYFYYVPGDQLFKSCPLRITSDQVIIYSHDFKLLIAHPIARKGTTGRYIGLPPAPTHARVLKLSEVKQRLCAMGEIMAKYIEKLMLQKKDPTGALNGLLALKVHYFTEDILKAVHRAMDHGVYDIKTIERFPGTHAQGRDAIKTLFDQTPDDEDYT